MPVTLSSVTSYWLRLQMQLSKLQRDYISCVPKHITKLIMLPALLLKTVKDMKDCVSCSLYTIICISACLCVLFSVHDISSLFKGVCVCMLSPVTMTVRMLAWWRSCSTAGVSAFSLFCMMIRPRNSMFASMGSLI